MENIIRQRPNAQNNLVYDNRRIKQFNGLASLKKSKSLMALFFSRDSNLSSELVPLLDEIYRIDESELQNFLEQHFGVRAVAGTHHFNKVPNKAGGEGRVDAFGKQAYSRARLRKTILKSPPISIYADDEFCLFEYATPAQQFEMWFEAKTGRMGSWLRVIRANPPLTASLLLYLFNRIRASNFLEKEINDERKFIRETFAGLRTPGGAATALQKITQNTNFDWAVVYLYGLPTQMLVPVACSAPATLKKMAACSASLLETFSKLRTGGDTSIINALHPGKQNCNCKIMHELGAQQVLHIRFGHDALITGEPRGVLSLYRRSSTSVQTKEQVFVEHAAREIAGWIDELDEMIEHEIARDAISTAEKKCGDAAIGTFDESMLEAILRSLGVTIEESLNRYHNLEGSWGSVRCGFLAYGHVVGSVPAWVIAKHTASTHKQKHTVYESSGSAALVICAPDQKTALVVWSHMERLTLLRSHIYEWLYELMGLVHHLITVESKRLMWIHRLIHDVRQPLQGLLTMGSEIRRLSGLKEVNKWDIGNYAEDMETSIMRIKVMIEIFNNLTRLESDSKVASTQIEADILRPMRRLLAAHARKRRVEIAQTIAYELIPAFNSDPDLLSIVFYNLLDNAIKYSKEGSQIKIVCYASPSSYSVEITNTGYIINQEEVPRIFEEGYRGVAVRNKEVGLGIGLHFARTIARKLGLDLLLKDPGYNSGSVTIEVVIPKGART